MPKQKPAAPKDLVDDLYIPFARPLGNLVILFAQAEARWLELVVELTGCTHKEAQRLLTISAADAKREVIPFAQARGIEGPELDELSVSIDHYFRDREQRNRLIHDEWFITVLTDSPVPKTRGLPRKKGAKVA
jgi:hypothetical protein